MIRNGKNDEGINEESCSKTKMGIIKTTKIHVQSISIRGKFPPNIFSQHKTLSLPSPLPYHRYNLYLREDRAHKYIFICFVLALYTSCKLKATKMYLSQYQQRPNTPQTLHAIPFFFTFFASFFTKYY